jgi:hypothetical protein
MSVCSRGVRCGVQTRSFYRAFLKKFVQSAVACCRHTAVGSAERESSSVAWKLLGEFGRTAGRQGYDDLYWLCDVTSQVSALTVQLGLNLKPQHRWFLPSEAATVQHFAVARCLVAPYRTSVALPPAQWPALQCTGLLTHRSDTRRASSKQGDALLRFIGDPSIWTSVDFRNRRFNEANVGTADIRSSTLPGLDLFCFTLPDLKFNWSSN